jgi:hypothetical protein
MITRGTLVRAVDRAEADYLKCWSVLERIKLGQIHGTFSTDFHSFQATLCLAMMRLETLYRQIHEEKRHLIDRKQSVSTTWFAKRMKTLDGYADSITRTVSIGKVIGDGFAWLFYQLESDLLFEHHKHEPVFHLPIGDGGLGELEFLKNRLVPPGLVNHLIIYHGTTSFLRLGDVSFIDLASIRVAAIGELKTKRIDDEHISVTVALLAAPGLRTKLGFDSVAPAQGRQQFRLPPEMLNKLKRQVQQIDKALTKSRKDASPELVHKSNKTYVDDLISLSTTLKVGVASYRKAGDGLLLVGLKLKRGKVSSRLCRSSPTNTERLLRGVPEEAIQIVDQSRSDNRAIISSLVYASSPEYSIAQGMTPFVWWPIDIDFMKAIVFQQTLIFTVFNPSHLLRRLESLGLAAHYNAEKNGYSAMKRDATKVVQLMGMPFFLSMIQQNLFSEDTVIEIIQGMLSEVGNKHFEQDTLVQFNIRQIF